MLKKGITIFFLFIYLFNLVGYRALFTYMDKAISSRLITQLDRGAYNDAELVEVKIPYPLPYAANWPEYQRFDGEADINGMHYNYVKRRISNDTLYLLCIPNYEKTKLAATSNDYVKNTADAANMAGGKKPHSPVNTLQKVFDSDCNNPTREYNLAVPLAAPGLLYASSSSGLCNAYAAVPFLPPRLPLL